MCINNYADILKSVIDNLKTRHGQTNFPSHIVFVHGLHDLIFIAINYQALNLVSNSELDTTVTELNAIANAARSGRKL